MSTGNNLSIGVMPDDGFIIKSICGCRIVYGSVPISEFSMLTHGFSKKALMAADIADRIGAKLVIGEPDDLEALRKLDLPVSEKRHRDYQIAIQMGLPDVAMWLRTGERGASSNAMCKRIFNIPLDAGNDHPHDPDDLRRCLLFLDASRAHDKVQTMSGVSPEWDRLVPVWDQLVSTFNEEMRAGGTAQMTYKLLQQIQPT